MNCRKWRLKEIGTIVVLCQAAIGALFPSLGDVAELRFAATSGAGPAVKKVAQNGTFQRGFVPRFTPTYSFIVAVRSANGLSLVPLGGARDHKVK